MTNSSAFLLPTVFLSVPDRLPGLGGGIRQLAGPPKEKIPTTVFSYLVPLCFYLDCHPETMGYLSIEHPYFRS